MQLPVPPLPRSSAGSLLPLTHQAPRSRWFICGVFLTSVVLQAGCEPQVYVGTEGGLPDAGGTPDAADSDGEPGACSTPLPCPADEPGMACVSGRVTVF